MRPGEALEDVRARFPFPGYLDTTGEACLRIAESVLRTVPPGASVLDFGCGPCDKTAVLSALGYRCTGVDDLRDQWHEVDRNRDRILEFARASAIEFQAPDGLATLPQASFDLVMIHDVLEHLHDSPRELVNALVGLVKPGGYFYASVPNAANVRKRIAILRGQTNYPEYSTYFWTPGPWRGHVREYVRDDLASLARNLGLEIEEVAAVHHHVEAKVSPRWRALYTGITRFGPGLRDTWQLIARRPEDWQPARVDEERRRDVLRASTPYRGA